MNPKNSVPRLLELDVLRSLAILSMVIYHVFFILTYFSVISFNFENTAVVVFARAIQITFISLVGISMSISSKKYTNSAFGIKRQLQRGGLIFLCALTINIVTYLSYPEDMVKFGILHLISTGIFLSIPFLKRPFVSLILGLLIFGVARLFSFMRSSSLILHIIGIQNSHSSDFDYFPIFPWVAFIFIGIFLGNFVYTESYLKRRKSYTSSPVLSKFLLLGRHSLAVYMIHIPVIMAIIFTLKFFNLI